MRRHKSFDPRMGGSRRRAEGGGGGGGGNGGGYDEAWGKLVKRVQELEEALSSERASKRLLAARASHERAELKGQLDRAKEDREGMEHLWRDAKQQLTMRMADWEAERLSLYLELSRLRENMQAAGLEPTPPQQPPANLAVALRDAPGACAAEGRAAMLSSSVVHGGTLRAPADSAPSTRAGGPVGLGVDPAETRRREEALERHRGEARAAMLKAATLQWYRLALAMPWRTWRQHTVDAKVRRQVEQLARQAVSLDGVGPTALAARAAALAAGGGANAGFFHDARTEAATTLPAVQLPTCAAGGGGGAAAVGSVAIE